MTEDDKNLPRDEEDPFAEDPFAEEGEDSSVNRAEDSTADPEGDSSAKREADSSAQSEEDSSVPDEDESDSKSQDDSQSDSEEDENGYDEENPYADSEYDSSEYGGEYPYGENQDDALLHTGEDSHGYPEDDPYADGTDNSSVDSPEDSSSDSTETSLAKRGDDSPPDDEDDPLADSRMSFGEHLDDLRSRLLKAIYGLLVGFIVCLIFGEEIFSFLAQPLLIALKWSGQEPQLFVGTLPESFITYIKVSLFAGLFVSCPWVFYQLWVFIAAGLYPRERKYVHRVIPFSAILFLLGGAFFIFIVAPISCSFFIRFTSHYPMPNIKSNPVFKWLLPAITGKEESKDESSDEELSPEAKVLLALLDPCVEKEILTEEKAEEYRQQIRDTETDEEKSFVKPWFTLQKYISLIMVLGLAFGVAFQMPLVVFFLGRMQFVQISTFKANRKFVIFGLVIVSALMTPPDVISQVALVIPMYFLYELGILMVRIWPPKRVE
jgi:sec-independent protein translocase protein TatC